jgi:DNA-binding response OmpR family regulator
MSDEVLIGRLEDRGLFVTDGTAIPITAREFDLQEPFAPQPNCVLSRDPCWNWRITRRSDGFNRSIDTRITCLAHRTSPMAAMGREPSLGRGRKADLAHPAG